MTGLTSNSEYGHLEIDWTCAHPQYRHKGYMQALFVEMLKDAHDDIYCSCWCLPKKIKQIYIPLCICLVLRKLFSPEYIGKFLIIVFVITMVVAHVVLVKIVNVTKICI